MNLLPPPALPALAAALALLFAGEILLPGSPAVPPHKMFAIPSAAPEAAADEAAGQWGDTILARPLFSPDRRPVSAAGTDTSTSLPRLSAIIITGGTHAAVFSADGQKPQVVTAGGSIDGYQLDSIAPDSVQLTGPDGPLTLRPQFITSAPAIQIGRAHV